MSENSVNQKWMDFNILKWILFGLNALLRTRSGHLFETKKKKRKWKIYRNEKQRTAFRLNCALVSETLENKKNIVRNSFSASIRMDILNEQSKLFVIHLPHALSALCFSAPLKTLEWTISSVEKYLVEIEIWLHRIECDESFFVLLCACYIWWHCNKLMSKINNTKHK